MKLQFGTLLYTALGIASIVLTLFAFESVQVHDIAVGISLGLVLSESIILASLPVLFILFGVRLESRFVIFRERGVEVRVEREPVAVRIVKKLPLLPEIAGIVEKRIKVNMVKAGMETDPYTYAARYTFYSVVLAILMVPVALVLSAIISPTFLALMAIPAILFYTPSISVRNNVQERKESLKDELPFFALLASIMQSAGRPMYETFMSIIGKGVLPAMELEARLLRKTVGFGKEILTALSDLASTHPDEDFKQFLYGYTAVLKSGGDAVLYLSDRVKEYLASMKFRWQSYAEKTGSIGEMLIIMFLLLPLLLVVGAVTMPPELVAEIAYVGVAALPMIAIVMYFVIRVAQPKTRDILSGNIRIGLIGVVIGGAMGSVSGQLWLTIAIAGAVGGALYGIPIRAQIREIRLTEQALPEFLRNVAEYRKIGYNMRKAIIETGRQAKFNPVFDAILSRIVAQMNLGVRLGEVRVAIRSWLGRMTIFVLDQIGESGGGTPANIEDLYNFISSYNRLRKEALASVRLYKLIGYAIPVIIPLIVRVVGGIVSSFGPAATQFLGGGPGSLDVVNAMVALLTVVSAGSIGLTMGRATDFTAKNTLNLTIMFSLTIVAVALVQYLPNVSLFPTG